MTTYKELFGKYVQNYASDPTSTDAEGQIWYNSTSGTFKTALGSFGAFSAGGNLNTGRTAGGGVGTQTAALGFGGYVSVPAGYTDATESYNGTSWTTLPATMSTARTELAGSGSGTQTLALVFGGSVPPQTAATEEFTDPSFGVRKITTS